MRKFCEHHPFYVKISRISKSLFACSKAGKKDLKDSHVPLVNVLEKATRLAVLSHAMSKRVRRIPPPKFSDAITSNYPTRTPVNGFGQYIETPTSIPKCDYWMFVLGAALSEERGINSEGK